MNAEQTSFVKDVITSTRNPNDIPMAVAYARLYMDACDDLGISGRTQPCAAARDLAAQYPPLALPIAEHTEIFEGLDEEEESCIDWW